MTLRDKHGVKVEVGDRIQDTTPKQYDVVYADDCGALVAWGEAGPRSWVSALVLLDRWAVVQPDEIRWVNCYANGIVGAATDTRLMADRGERLGQRVVAVLEINYTQKKVTWYDL